MMKSIICTYPDFRELPKGLKRMLVISETLFFEELQSASSFDDDHGTHSWALARRPFAGKGYGVLAGV
jgi:hypothetical protein